MPKYLYDDEDNAAMCPELMNEWNPLEDRDGHNPTIYTSLAEMKYFESLPFTDIDPVEGVEEEEPHYGNAP